MSGLRCHHCTERNPGPQSARDFILVDFFMGGRIRFDRLIARYEFASFNHAAADARRRCSKASNTVAAMTTALAISTTR
jgi:hypothetical protein